ncbi:hypothetical protein GEMRC1_003101 [Eukaryota sp. GEM-RC1]
MTSPLTGYFKSLGDILNKTSARSDELKLVHDGSMFLPSSTSPLSQLKHQICDVSDTVIGISNTVFKDPLSELFDAILEVCTSTQQSLAYITGHLNERGISLPDPPQLTLPSNEADSMSDSSLEGSESPTPHTSHTPYLPKTPAAAVQPVVADIKTPTLDGLGLSDLALGALSEDKSSLSLSNQEEIQTPYLSESLTFDIKEEPTSQLRLLESITETEHSQLQLFIRSSISLSRINDFIGEINDTISEALFQPDNSFLPSKMTLSELLQIGKMSRSEAEIAGKPMALALMKLGRVNVLSDGDETLYSLNN